MVAFEVCVSIGTLSTYWNVTLKTENNHKSKLLMALEEKQCNILTHMDLIPKVFLIKSFAASNHIIMAADH